MTPPAGYSGTPLWKKLGIKSDSMVVAANAPENYRDLVAGYPEGVTFTNEVLPPVAFVHLFVVSLADLKKTLAKLKAALAPDGVIWVSWPKKAAKVKTDITENAIRDSALPLGLVDVKVCAVDETWSGLKIVIRVANRK